MSINQNQSSSNNNSSNVAASLETNIIDNCGYCNAKAVPCARVVIYSEVEMLGKYTKRRFVRPIEHLESVCETCVLTIVGDESFEIYDTEINPPTQFVKALPPSRHRVDLNSLEVLS